MARVKLFDKEPDKIDKLDKIEIAKPTYKSVVVDTAVTPKNSILTHIRGGTMVVNYYRRFRDTSEELASYSPNTDPIYQQYELILGMELKVTTPLNTVQDTETGKMKVEGVSILYPVFVPNEGDFFITDIGDGRVGVFEVNRPEKRSQYKLSPYQIYYSQIGLVGDDGFDIESMNKKVVSKVHFVKDYIHNGRNPLLSTDEYVLAKELSKLASSITNNHFDYFYNNKLKTLVLPNQDYMIYDPFLVNNLTKFFNVENHKNFLNIKKLNLDEDPAFKTYSIFNAIESIDYSLIKNGFKKYYLVNSNSFNNIYYCNGIFFTGIDLVVYPNTDIRVGDHLVKDNYKQDLNYFIKPSFIPEVDDAETKESLDGSSGDSGVPPQNDIVSSLDYPKTYRIDGGTYLHSDQSLYSLFDGEVIGKMSLIHPVTKDDYYIFSESFYELKEGLSILEMMMLLMLHRKKVDNKLLLDLCHDYPNWGSLEKFYYAPFLIVLINYSLKVGIT